MIDLICKILCGVGVIYILDVTLPEYAAAYRARKISKQTGKPILNVGAGTKKSSFTGPKYRGHINCDLAAEKNIPCGGMNICHCDVQDLSRFGDKEFCAVIVANVLQYVPDQQRALRELHRVADVVLATDNWIPWPQLGPGHRVRRHIVPIPCKLHRTC